MAAVAHEADPGSRDGGRTRRVPAAGTGGRSNGVARFLIAMAVVGLSCWMGLAMSRPGGLAAFWPANGVLIAFLVTAPRRHWGTYIAGSFFANFLVIFGRGLPLWPTSQIVLASALEILVASWPFLDIAPQRPDLTNGRLLARFVLFGGVLGPLVSGLWYIATTFGSLHHYSTLTKFRLWVAGDSLGILLLTPLTLALLDPELIQLLVRRRLVETVALLGLLGGSAVLVFRGGMFPFPFLVLVVLIPIVFRLGLAGAAIGVLLISIPAVHYTFAGQGPFARIGVLYWSFFLQLYFVTLLATIYVLAAVHNKEKRLTDELRVSESRCRVLAENSQDVIVRTDLQGVWSYISPSLYSVTGWTEEELPPPVDPFVLIHPADRTRYEDFLDRLRTRPGNHSLVYRARRKDGQYAWLEAHVGTVFNRQSVAEELVWTVRDVSLRVAHEERLKWEKLQAQAQAWTDALTGLNNRRAFDERLAAEWTSASRYQLSLSLLLLDIDHFKSYNDIYGQPNGDECLRQIARIIGECIRRPADLAVRYSGKEFAVVLSRADVERAREVATQIQEKMQELALNHAGSALGRVTLSIGIASTGHGSYADADSFVAAAGRALHESKLAGCNQVTLAS